MLLLAERFTSKQQTSIDVPLRVLSLTQKVISSIFSIQRKSAAGLTWCWTWEWKFNSWLVWTCTWNDDTVKLLEINKAASQTTAPSTRCYWDWEAPPSLLERKATINILAEYRAATGSSRVSESYSCFVLGGKRREGAQLPLETPSPIISDQSGISLKAQKEHESTIRSQRFTALQ